MKNSIILLCLTVILFQSCKKDDKVPTTCESCNFTCLDENDSDVIKNDCIDNWTCEFYAKPLSKVDKDEGTGVASGDKNVFQLRMRHEGDEDIADDEYTWLLVLELDDNQTSFSTEDEELENLNIYFKWVCFCPDVEFRRVSSGCIQGEKQSDGNWFIQGNLLAPVSSNDDTIELKFEAQFVVE